MRGVCECRPAKKPFEQPANLMDDLLGLSTASASDPFASDLSGVMDILDTVSKPADPMDFSGILGTQAQGVQPTSDNVIDYASPAPATDAATGEPAQGEGGEAE